MKTPSKRYLKMIGHSDMNKNQARIAKLEGRLTPLEAPLITIRFVGVAEGGGPEEWNPDWASGGGRHLGDGIVLRRNADESPEAFQERARVRFPEGLLFMGADPEQEMRRR